MNWAFAPQLGVLIPQREPCSQLNAQDKPVSYLVSISQKKKHRATNQPIVSQHSLSRLAQTDQPTTDQLSKEGRRQPRSQPTDQDKSISF